ncbi:amino acid dehydrogenase [Pseudomonas sp. S04]|uniref:NAD(P)/FAD-dependent oxidoreductase n=1 Tax=unclassified Pseudomonas TaxID=196821 RepID=UPI00131FAE89|nr:MULTISPECIES: FAD-binding oxidoreductase [unclassified Pseudomonas]QHD00771.1 amino acid dehydrogenase [Pseudomonas sp. S04]QHF33256.1 amino acid dehydrogenase [Pseudomonas sp. S19]
MNEKQVVVLGAGIVGVCTALHLQRRGCAVTLVDKGLPGRETSFGNAGIIQREAIEPYAFPRDLASLINVATKRDIGVNYHLRAMPEYVPALVRYWANSAPRHYQAIADAFRTLIEHSISEHSELIEQSGSQNLIVRKGWIQAFRSPKQFDEAVERAVRVSAHGVLSEPLDGVALRLAEPALSDALVGGIHWLQPWTCIEPGELVQRYADLFVREGGEIVRGDARSLRQSGAGWSVATDSGSVGASQVVVALGPWAHELLGELGYRIPLFVKRGYHAHFADGATLSRPVLDTEQGYMLAPMKRGVRLSTGAEFASLSAPPTPVQLAKAERAARQVLALGPQVERTPWNGARPCTVDMKPVIGAAPLHKGLWFNFGHAHQGFTLGPVSGRLLAELMMCETPVVDPAPFAPGRF